MFKRWLRVFVILWIGFPVSAGLTAQEPVTGIVAKNSRGLSLNQAVMCEGIRDFAPYNQAVVFSMEIGKIYCFTSFDHVPQKTVIFHNWYRADNLVTTKRLSLQPPEWSTFSSIQLREADKGPWRLEIQNEAKEILRILRFSITD